MFVFVQGGKCNIGVYKLMLAARVSQVEVYLSHEKHTQFSLKDIVLGFWVLLFLGLLLVDLLDLHVFRFGFSLVLIALYRRTILYFLSLYCTGLHPFGDKSSD